MTYDFGTKQVAAGSTDSNPQGETQKFTPGTETIFLMEGNDPFVNGYLKFASNPASTGLSANLSAVFTDVATGEVIPADKSSISMNASKVDGFHFPNKEGVKYRAVITADQPYACAVLWAPQKAKAPSTSPDRG